MGAIYQAQPPLIGQKSSASATETNIVYTAAGALDGLYSMQTVPWGIFFVLLCSTF